MNNVKDPESQDSLTISEKYLEVLKSLKEWVTVSEWAIKFGEIYPDLLEKAEEEAKNHKRPSTGLREIAARISSNVSTGKFTGHIEVDESERPKKIRILSDEAILNYVDSEIETDLEPLTRTQKIKADEEVLTVKERYRIQEFETIISQLKDLFGLDFELEHSKAILNPKDPGRHHPDNIQILLKSHNRTKGNSNWQRFTLNEQIEYISAVVKVQKIISERVGINIEDDVLKSVIERLKLIF